MFNGYKTLIANALIVALGLAGLQIDPAQAMEYANAFVILAGLVNIVLRAVTKGPIFAGRNDAAVKLTLTLCLIVPLLAGLSACASHVADSPAQTVYGIQADLTIGQHLAAGYVASSQAKPEVVDAVRRLEATAVEAVKAAQAAARKGDDPTAPALIATASNAVAAFRHYLEGARHEP